MSSLEKSLSLPALIALGAAGVLGTSWIYTNGQFFARYGAGGEIAGLLLATLIAATIALAYAELATRLPQAGGEVIYAHTAFGRASAFVVGWLLLGAYLASLALYVTAAGPLLAPIWPAIQSYPLYSLAGATVHAPALLVGIALAILVYAANRGGAALGARVQIALFGLMIAIGVCLAVTGFADGRLANAWPAWSPAMHPMADTARFVIPAMTFLTGFSLVTLLAEDAALPPRGVAAAALATVAVSGLFYIVVLTAAAWIIPWQTTATLARGTIDAFSMAGQPRLSAAALGISLLGLVTSFLALFLAASRVILALARLGLLPARLARLDARARPVNALWCTLVATLLPGLLGPGALGWFLDAGGVYIGLAWLLGVASFYRLRQRESGHGLLPRGLAWAPGLGALMALLLVLARLLPGTGMTLASPGEYALIVGWFAVGFLVYGWVTRALTSRRGYPER